MSRPRSSPLRVTRSRVTMFPGVLLLLLALLPACGDDVSGQLSAALAEARAKLASDPSAALFVAKKALNRPDRSAEPEDPRLALVAAAACLRLERRNEAIEWATLGLGAPGLDRALDADLLWARGAALMGRYRELGDEADWRAASLALEQATGAGDHRLEAAVLMVFMQDLGSHRNDERQLRFARLAIELDAGPGRDGSQADLVRRLLAKKGLTP